MFVIRQEQLAVFEPVATERFEDEMLAHIRKYFPIAYRLLGLDAVRSGIRCGIARGMEHGFAAKGQLCRYVDLCLALGLHFDRDPLLPWATRIFEPDLPDTPAERMERMDDRAMRYLGAALGEAGEHFLRAVRRVQRLTYEDLGNTAEDLEPTVRTRLRHLQPTKYALVDDTAWQRFFGAASAYSACFALVDRAAQETLCTLMFLLGTHVLEDPFYPWAAAALAPEGESELRGRQLYDRGMAFAEEALLIIQAPE